MMPVFGYDDALDTFGVHAVGIGCDVSDVLQVSAKTGVGVPELREAPPHKHSLAGGQRGGRLRHGRAVGRHRELEHAAVARGGVHVPPVGGERHVLELPARHADGIGARRERPIRADVEDGDASVDQHIDRVAVGADRDAAGVRPRLHVARVLGDQLAARAALELLAAAGVAEGTELVLTMETGYEDVKAAVLYTQGFEDSNVKSAMITHWFNALTVPKLGLFGHWLHQHPPRLDTEALMVGWLEQHLKGKDIGFDRLPAAVIQVDRETERYASEWPPTQPKVTTLWPALAGDTLGTEAAEGSASIALDHSGATGADGTRLTYRGRLTEDVSLAGSATMRVAGTLVGASTAYLMAELYEGEALVSYGQVNLAHNADHTQYNPITPGQPVYTDMPFRPTERILKAGSEVTLVLRGVAVDEAELFVGQADGLIAPAAGRVETMLGAVEDRCRGKLLEVVGELLDCAGQRGPAARNRARAAGAAAGCNLVGVALDHPHPLRRQAEAAAERLPITRRLSVEPPIERLRPGDDDTLRWHAVHADRLVTLRLVPDDDDVRDVALPVLRHRLTLRAEAELDGVTPDAVISDILRSAEVPR